MKGLMKMTSDSPLLNNKSPTPFETFSPAAALCRGTLFPDLAMGYQSPPLETADALPFALTDLRLYLDTHPCHLVAHALYRRLAAEADLPVLEPSLDTYCPLQWTWIDDPWPWEKVDDTKARVCCCKPLTKEV